jgi:hypothetical protein
MRKPTEGRLLVEERWASADAAPRLSAEVPGLQSLKLSVSEWRAGAEIPGTAYVRLFVLQSAPAHFFVPCGDRRCKDGGHDLTREIMYALQRKSTEFGGEDECRGNVGGGECSRVLRFTLAATFA